MISSVLSTQFTTYFKWDVTKSFRRVVICIANQIGDLRKDFCPNTRRDSIGKRSLECQTKQLRDHKLETLSYTHQPPPEEQIVFFNCRDLYLTPPDSGKRQYKSMT